MENDSLVSIITPMYKGEAFVGETIESVLRQTYADWEMIIVDDCSPDGGAGIRVVRQYADPRIRLIESKVNKGSSGARNIALREARGRYIAFLDSDDVWHPDFLARQLDFMKRNGAYLVFGREDAGLPEALLAANQDWCIRMPMREGARSLNLSNSVAVGVYEVLRQWDFPELLDHGHLRDYEWK